ncbi:MAG: hypothetical protein M1462_07710 [Candidatus Thermoplasmatota archaeon]|uniref:hypothetical protein n=1 Tax=Ferroplasma sp. Type II TaxID=261388 RepID=UPI0003895A29|nr:hypothetical protein [Ferroplasma sp. Type II]EQB73082.1 MAG: hypothetical protein AMDU4_FER2C00104G0002 [Ferroplasma sp. Type II]MCL4312291.1 hypothetical protein [Candidatus Thermoplasmatota archaeon]
MDQKYSFAYLGITVIMALLFMQFIMGMYINLYVSFPPMNSITHMGPHNFPSNYIVVMFHMMLGFLILVVSFIMVLLSLRIRNSKLVISSFLSFFFVIVAGISGFLFLFNEKNLYSLLMAISFIIIVLSEFYYLYVIKVTENKLK